MMTLGLLVLNQSWLGNWSTAVADGFDCEPLPTSETGGWTAKFMEDKIECAPPESEWGGEWQLKCKDSCAECVAACPASSASPDPAALRPVRGTYLQHGARGAGNTRPEVGALLGHRAGDGRALHVALDVDDDTRVVLKVDEATALGPPPRLALPHNNSRHDCA